MIVRILGEGQFDIGDAGTSELNRLDTELEAAVNRNDEAAFTALVVVRSGSTRYSDPVGADSARSIEPTQNRPAGSTAHSCRATWAGSGEGTRSASSPLAKMKSNRPEASVTKAPPSGLSTIPPQRSGIAQRRTSPLAGSQRWMAGGPWQSIQ